MSKKKKPIKASSRWLPTPLTRSCLFYPIKNAVYLPHDKPIETDLYNGRILQKFVLLGPKHMRVMLWVLYVVEQRNNSGIWFYKKELMRNYFGPGPWTGRQYHEMDELVRQITEAWFHLEYKFQGKTEKQYTHLINYRELSDDLKPEADNIISINVNTFLLKHFLTKFITWLDDAKLASMKRPATPILYAFLHGQQPFYSGKRYPLSREVLFKAIGMHTVAKVKRYQPYRAKATLEAGLDELGAMGELDDHIRYEDHKGVMHLGWEYDKLRDSYIIKKAPKKVKQMEIKQLEAKNEPIEVKRLAGLAKGLWMQSDFKQAFMEPSVFNNVAQRAMAANKEYGHRVATSSMAHEGLSGPVKMLHLSLECLDQGGNVPTGANFWAQAKFWEEELPYWLVNMRYMEPVGPKAAEAFSATYSLGPEGGPTAPFNALPPPDEDGIYD